MAKRGPLSAAKRKRELEKHEKRMAKLERRAQRAAERARAREAVGTTEGNHPGGS
jgi:hypothetical protein